MRIDIVVGNPPYSRGSDMDFVQLGFRTCTKFCLMITPAKWQNAEEDQHIKSESTYGEFRRTIVPHIRHLCFFPEGAEIFAIRNIDGISYYLIDKVNNYVGRCTIENKCNHQSLYNSIETRDITHEQTLNNIGNKVIESLGEYKRFHFLNRSHKKRYQVYTGSQINGGCGWGYLNRNDPCSTYDRNGQMYCIGLSRIDDALDENLTKDREAETLVFSSDNIEECKSFVSWLNTCLVRFMVLMNVSKLNNILTDHYFRFVPFEDNFNHIFTDEEMYEKYGLSEDNIKVIESIIKKRV